VHDVVRLGNVDGARATVAGVGDNGSDVELTGMRALAFQLSWNTLEKALTKLHVGKKKTTKKAGKRRREEDDEELRQKVQALEKNVVDLTQNVEDATSETRLKQVEDAMLDTVEVRLREVFDRINTFTKWKTFFAQGHTFGGINGYTGDGGGSAGGGTAAHKPMDSDDIREEVIAFICCERERNSS
jgi:hypothetical protein